MLFILFNIENITFFFECGFTETYIYPIDEN